MTTSSNSWVKYKGDKSRAMPFLAEFFICRCAVCWSSYCPLTYGESQVDFKKIHSLLRSFCSTSWRQHEWVSCEWTGGVCSCRAPLAMNWKSFVLIPCMHLSPLNYLFHLFSIPSTFCFFSPPNLAPDLFPLAFIQGEKREWKIVHCMTVQNLLQSVSLNHHHSPA